MAEKWFIENVPLTKSISTGIKILKKLHSMQTKFQKLEVYETEIFGKMLVLDNAIQTTENDEFGYHEMIVHVPLIVHKNPKKVLIIGGGDGGVVKELLKHNVDEIHLCEIDEEVVKQSLRFLPMAQSMKNEKVKIFYEDGAKFVKENKGYDVVIVDSSDPLGPAEVLFKKEFFKDIFNCLNKDGIMVSQCESFFYHRHIIKNVLNNLKEIFPILSYYYTLVPTYPSGLIGFTFCSKKYKPDEIEEKRISKLNDLKFYNKEIHKSAFILPEFAKEIFSE